MEEEQSWSKPVGEGEQTTFCWLKNRPQYVVDDDDDDVLVFYIP